MKFRIKVKLQKNINNLLRDCGYRLHPKDQKSYIRPISSFGFYPRWHLYIEEKNGIFIFNLHLDQKRASYKNQTAHSGDYDEEIIKKEAERIINLIVKYNK